MQEEVTHREIYERLIEVESKVDKLTKDTGDIVTAFHAAQGAFIVLEWLARIAKPLLWIIGLSTLLGTIWNSHKG
jgi:hypothetical protein